MKNFGDLGENPRIEDGDAVPDEIRYPHKKIEREVAEEMGNPDLVEKANREDDLITDENTIILGGGFYLDDKAKGFRHGYENNPKAVAEMDKILNELRVIREQFGEELDLFRLKSFLRCRANELFWPTVRFLKELYQPKTIDKFAGKLNDEEIKQLLDFIQQSLARPLGELLESKRISELAAAEAEATGEIGYEKYGSMRESYSGKDVGECERHLLCLSKLLPVLPKDAREQNQRMVDETSSLLNWVKEKGQWQH